MTCKSKFLVQTTCTWKSNFFTFIFITFYYCIKGWDSRGQGWALKKNSLCTNEHFRTKLADVIIVLWLTRPHTLAPIVLPFTNSSPQVFHYNLIPATYERKLAFGVQRILHTTKNIPFGGFFCFGIFLFGHFFCLGFFWFFLKWAITGFFFSFVFSAVNSKTCI